MKETKFAVIGSAHSHIYEFIDDMLKAGGIFTGIYNDRSNLTGIIAQKYNVPLYDDINALFDAGIQVAGTTAVNADKIDIIEQCSNHGVHIIADKPVVLNEEQYKRLEAVTGKGAIEVGLMLTVRFMPEVYTVKKLLMDGHIGTLTGIEIFNPHKLSPSKRPAWHFEEKENGGIVIDLMIHSIDLFHWLAESRITDFSGIAQKTVLPEKESFFDSCQFFATSSSGVSGYFRVDWHIPDSHWNWGDFRIFCTGSKGCLEARCIGDPVTAEPQVILLEDGKKTEKVDIEPFEGSVTLDFLNRINKKEYVIGHEDILDACRVTLDFNKNVVKKRMI